MKYIIPFIHLDKHLDGDYTSFGKSPFNDQSSTKTKYIKLNSKTQNIFCCVNENLANFLYNLTGGDKKKDVSNVMINFWNT